VSDFAFYHPVCFTILALAALLTGLVALLLLGGVQYIETYRPNHVEHFEDKRKMP
jgi:hypothetical protein